MIIEIVQACAYFVKVQKQINAILTAQTNMISLASHFFQLGWLSVLALSLLLQACGSPRTLVAKSEVSSGATPIAGSKIATLMPPGKSTEFFIPKDFFKSNNKTTKNTGPPVTLNTPIVGTGNTPTVKSMIWLYASPTAKAHAESAGIDFKVQVRIWETFLRKYHIPYKTITSVDALESSAPGVIVLPSLVALTEREKLAVAKFRAQGGGVLATWLTGVRDGNGAWQGFSFMENVLDARVVGDTANEEDANFLMTYGDGPITFNLPAGQRIWFERVKDIYPLRMTGQQSAANILDWSRNSVLDQAINTIVIGEKPQTNGVMSRSVVLGYPERLWMSTSPAEMEAIAHNALLWLLRQPSVHLGAWPYPFTNAVSVAIDAPEVVDEVDIKFSKRIELLGARATYYLVTENLLKSAESLKKLQTQGHELAFMADHFEGFKGQPEDKQRKRLLDMQQQMKASGLQTGSDHGFAAPMDAADKTTVAVLNQLGMGHYLALNDATDARIPVTQPRPSSAITDEPSMVMLPRTLSSPEALMNEGDPEDGLRQFLGELEISLAMGGLSLIRTPNQSLLSEEEWQPIFDRLKGNSKNGWFALTSQVAQWWRERSRVSVSMDITSGTPRLTVNLTGTKPLSRSASAMVNLPAAHSSLRLFADGHPHKLTTITAIDPWRVAVSLENLPPGTYRWLMQFDPLIATAVK